MKGAELILGMWATHHLLPTATLECMAIPPDRLPGVLRALAGVPGVRESIALSTCNRVEVYVCVEDAASPDDVTSGLLGVLAAPAHLAVEEIADLVVVATEEAAVSHFFAVACGLDSMVVGEYQVVAQIREALRIAQEAGTAGNTVGTLVRGAIRTSRLVRTQTSIGSVSTSMVSVGLSWAADVLGGLRGKDALLVGAGRMSQLAGTLLTDAGVSRLSVANRTAGHAEHLAQRLGAGIVDLGELGAALVGADVVVSTTGSPGYVISVTAVARAIAARPERSLFLLDLAVPRDVEPDARQIPGVTLVDVGAIGARLQDTRGADDVGAARSIITAAVGEFMRRRRCDQVAPLIIALRAVASEVVDAEARRLHNRLPDLDHRERQETDAALRRAVSKLIHAPTVRMKELADEPSGPMYLDALTVLFGLDEAGQA